MDQHSDPEAARLAEQVAALKAHIRTLEEGYEAMALTPPERPPAVGVLLDPRPVSAGTQEQRLRRIERMLEQLLAQHRPPAPPDGPAAASPTPPPADEDGPRAAAWERLMHDGLVGRFDAEPVNAVRFYTDLYRRYVGRRPSPEEVKLLFRLTGPGYEQWAADPETIIRRLFGSDWFAATPLGRGCSVAHARSGDHASAAAP